MAAPLMTITGIEDVQRMLTEAPKSVVARGYAKALGAGIGVFYVDLQTRTPVRQSEIYTAAAKGGRHPGDLRRALVSEVTLDSRFRGGTAEVGFSGFQGRVANWVENGHDIVKRGGTYIDARGRKRKGTVTDHVPAYPFMRPCADLRGDEAIEAFASSLEQTLRQGVLT